MKISRAAFVSLTCAALLLLPVLASATNGYFSHGVGLKAKGMGGAAIALSEDALAGGNNPAAMALLGQRLDLGVDVFRPSRSSEITGNQFGFDGTYDANHTANFFVPELGFCTPGGERAALGLSVYGNGGMNTSYTDVIGLTQGPAGFFGTTAPGVDLSQLFIAPTLAFQLSEQHALGIAVNVAWQRFKATGLENFDNDMTSFASGSVTNNDHSSSTGFGVRVGWLGSIMEGLTLGAAYQSRTYMGEFTEYAGLFAENGDFDVPASFCAGFAYEAEKATVAFDFQRIMYSQVNSLANPLLPNLQQAQLGTEGGPGFGWTDMNVFKAGVAYDATEVLTLRGGFNYGAQPIPTSETMFNILAPGVVEKHATLGATFAAANGIEVTCSFMHALESTVEGDGSIIPGTDPEQGQMGGGEANLTMSQNSFGIGFGKNF